MIVAKMITGLRSPRESKICDLTDRMAPFVTVLIATASVE